MHSYFGVSHCSAVACSEKTQGKYARGIPVRYTLAIHPRRHLAVWQHERKSSAVYSYYFLFKRRVFVSKARRAFLQEFEPTQRASAEAPRHNAVRLVCVGGGARTTAACYLFTN